jgi:hypothetical protein
VTASTDAAPGPATSTLEPPPSGSVGERAALGAFVLYLLVAWWVLIFDLGSGWWFLRDDWMFLSGRDGGSLHDLLEPHDVHPAAVPVVVFRVMFNLFGLWFTPYLVLIVTMHLGLVVLLRVVMRRAGVGPWVATAAASALVLFGPGEQNIHWAFQINFVGALVLGLTQLIMTDHDGPPDRRDAAGLLAGVAAVMCSGIGPLMVVGVAAATLARRGWRIALLHAGPPTAAYVLWVVLAEPVRYSFGRPSLGVVADWIREGVVGTVEGLGHYAVVAALLAGLLVVGTVILVTSTPRSELRRRAAVPGALLLCVPTLFVLTAQGRWAFGIEQARSSRYLYVGVVCLLPALALAADAVARRWRAGAVVAVVLLLVGVPGNVGEFGSSVFDDRYFELQRQMVLGLPRSAEAEQVPRWVRPLPDPYNGEDLTIGWLLDARDDGRLPSLDDPNPRTVARFPIALGLAHIAEPYRGGSCVDRSGPLDLTLRRGDRLGIRSGVMVATIDARGVATSPRVRFSPTAGETLSVELPSLELRFSPPTAGGSFTICR